MDGERRRKRCQTLLCRRSKDYALRIPDAHHDNVDWPAVDVESLLAELGRCAHFRDEREPLAILLQQAEALRAGVGADGKLTTDGRTVAKREPGRDTTQTIPGNLRRAAVGIEQPHAGRAAGPANEHQSVGADASMAVAGTPR
jgi:hypothetical protein